jgi:hypothetical protein
MNMQYPLDLGKPLIITKSLKDCIVLNKLGYNAIAPQGESAFLTEKELFCYKYIFGEDNIYLLWDNDLPGIGLLDDLLEDGNSQATLDSTYNWTTTQFLTRGLPNHSIISMGTRFHVDDVTGRLLKAEPEKWRVLNIPALCDDEENDPLGRKLGESHWP